MPNDMPPVSLPRSAPPIGGAGAQWDEPVEQVAPPAEPQAPKLPADGPNSRESWKNRLQASRDIVERMKPTWDANIERYLGKRPKGGHEGDIVVPLDFSNVEQKKAALFFQNPKVLISPLQPGLEKAAPIFEAVVNYRLSRKGVNAKAVVDEVLSDALCPSGIFAIKIGYEATVKGSKQVQTGMGPDPQWRPPFQHVIGAQMGIVPPPVPPQVPIYTDVPNIIAETYIFDRISPAKLLIPEEFSGSDYDKAPWLAFEFLMDFEVAKRLFKLDENFTGGVTKDDHLIGTQELQGKMKKVRGWEIYFKTSIFDPEEVHPEHQTLLILLDGVDEPVKYRPSPYQIQNPDGTLGGMRGFPIHVGSLRYVSDQAYSPSDCSMSRHQVDEISSGRTQMMYQRIRSTPMRVVDLVGIGGPEGLAKLEKNIWQGIFPVTQLDPMPIREVPQATMPPQNFTFDELARRDVSNIWAQGENQMGNINPTDRSATELTLAQNGGTTRLAKERTKFLDWFVQAAEKHAALIQMFADEKSYVEIVGAAGAKILTEWDKSTIQGIYGFDIKANSSAPTDTAGERAMFLQFYNLIGNSPRVNRGEVDAELVRVFDRDPDKMLNPDMPPMPPPPEKPRISFSFDDKSVDPSSPGFPIVMELLKAGGILIDEKAILAAQAAAGKQQQAMGVQQPVVADAVPHPPTPPPGAPGAPGAGGEGGSGGAPPAGGGAVVPLNKHQVDQTNSRPGPRVGGMASLQK